MWIRDLALGLTQLCMLQLLTGLWTTIILYHFRRCSLSFRYSLCLAGLAAVVAYAFGIFDPKTHVIEAVVTAFALAFSAPLRAMQLLHEQYCSINSEHPYTLPSPRYIFALTALPTARSSRQSPPAHPAAMFITGTTLLMFSGLLSLCYVPLQHLNFYPLTSIWLCMFCLTGVCGITYLTTGIFGAVAGSSYKIRRPFRRPWLAESLTSFWSKHWNIPVHQALRGAIYDPVTTIVEDDNRSTRKWKRAAGTILCFAYSGVIHEIVLLFAGVPVGKSRGEWFTFFMLHGSVVLVERRWKKELEMIPRCIRIALTLAFNITLASVVFFPVIIRLGLLHRVVKSLLLIPITLGWLKV